MKILLAVLMLTTIGCKAKKPDAPGVLGIRETQTLSHADVAGIWKGYFQTNHVECTEVTLAIDQHGTTLSGWWGDRFYPSCIITEGRVHQSDVYFEFPDHINRCLGTLVMRGDAHGDDMELSISGHNCKGEHQGDAKLKRQNHFPEFNYCEASIADLKRHRFRIVREAIRKHRNER